MVMCAYVWHIHVTAHTGGADLARAEWEVAPLLSSARKNVQGAAPVDTGTPWLPLTRCQVPIRQPCVRH